jgi:hypothetical protein
MPKRQRTPSPLDDLVLTTRAASTKSKADRSTPAKAPSPSTKPAASTKSAAPSTSNTSDADRKRSTSRKSASSEGTSEWEASHVRVTFYCPKSLLSEAESEIKRSGRSKTRLIVEALQSHLKALQSHLKAK